MKTKLLFITLFISTLFNAQSIEFTSAELTTAEIGSTVTINYKYTISSDGNIYCAINLYNDWTWAEKVVDGSLSPAPAGIDMTGTFSFTIPEGTTPTVDLTNPYNYKIVIELSDSSWTWLAGAYPATQINLTATTASLNDFSLEEFTIYPNPVKEKININGIESYENVTISIHNILGKQVKSIPNLKTNSINVEELNSGIYLIRIKNKSSSKTVKFIKN